MPRTLSTRRLAVLLSLVAGLPTAIAQDSTTDTSPLSVGKSLSGTLTGEAGSAYTITLDADSFVVGFADQISVDVVVTVLDPDGKRIGRFDGPGEGPERFEFSTSTSGEHTIEINPFEGASGDYTLQITRAEPIATDPGERVGQLMAQYDSPDTPGGVVAVYRDGGLIFAQGYGVANLEHNIPWTADTVTNIGSTSKQFTAMAIGLLAGEGKLSLDDDIRTHLPELPDLGHVVRVRNLLTHTTGYREYLNLLAMSGRQLGSGDSISRDEIIPIVQNQPELQNLPGEEFNYNNTSFALLTIVVERISGQPFDEWMDEHVFTPLGMDDTVVRADRGRWIPNRSAGYVSGDAGTFREAIDLGGSMGAGGIYTTVGDLAKWLENFSTGTVGGEGFINEMMTSFVLNDAKPTGYGLGLFLDDFGGQTRVHHGGADSAHRSQLMYFPELDAGVITQSNLGSFNGSIANEVARVFLAGDLTFEEETTEETENDTPSESEGMTVSPSEYETLVGDFEFEEMPGFVLSITMNDGALYGQATGQQRLSFEPTTGTTFQLDGEQIFVEFLIEDDGTCPAIMLHQNGKHKATRKAEKPWAPTAADLEVYAGRYFSEELETFYTLAVDEDKLTIQHRRFEVALRPGDEHVFAGGYPVAKVEFVTDDDGHVTGLIASNGRARGVRFFKQD